MSEGPRQGWGKWRASRAGKIAKPSRLKVVRKNLSGKQLAKQKGFQMPKPPSDIDLLAKKFAEDAQAEKSIDDMTGKPYRVYHAIPISGQMNLFVYVDIDEAPRTHMLKSAVHRREQMVSEGYSLSLDLDHWNRVNADQEPISLPMDITMDIEIRKASEDGGEEQASPAAVTEPKAGTVIIDDGSVPF